MLPNFGVHLLIAVVQVDPHAGLLELAAYFFPVFSMFFADRNHRHLDGREPYREDSGIVLDEHAKKPFHGAKQSAMDHQWLFPGAILGHVLELEPLRQVEVELDGAKLPGPADGIHQLDVDLGSVKSGLAGDDLVW